MLVHNHCSFQEIETRNIIEPNKPDLRPFEVVRVRAAPHTRVHATAALALGTLVSCAFDTRQVRNRLDPEFDSKHSAGKCCARELHFEHNHLQLARGR
jgi:hypothetical protein